MDAQEYFNRGMAFFEDRNYGPAIENLETALRLSSGNEELCEKLRGMIEEMKLCAKDKAEAERLTALNNSLRS